MTQVQAHRLGARWAAQRLQFAGLHLDTAAAGRTSIGVQRAVADHLRREAQHGAYVAEAAAATAVDTGRAQLGELLGLPKEGIALSRARRPD